ncbi:hypothetical protein [Acanthopleuribacter pedis]|uniref:Uncharacterized protein n=1 Tax=Acanthopleuribacter pedis TaxID=442870 RepID=A0A8J7Q7L0_9BACT|nr:hypothetical protein [Acanthopleuribacter pedis]MBO1318804.1 hypothetical protein [Acanthopleuribacter pedis]
MLSHLAGAVLIAALAAPAVMIVTAWVSINWFAGKAYTEIPAQEQGAVRIAEPTTTPFSSPGSP